jgi:DNA-binding MarR family transcriptional regulator
MARRRASNYFFPTFNGFVDLGVRHLSRSEIAAYLVLLRDTKPDGTARTSFGSIASRRGMSQRQAVRAVQSLIRLGVVEVVRRGGRGIGATTYCVVPGGIEIFRRERMIVTQVTES